MVMMRGGFSPAEQLLFEGGHGDVVRESWHKLQDTLEEQISDTITGLTGRDVTAFMSATHQAPDLRWRSYSSSLPIQARTIGPSMGDTLYGARTGQRGFGALSWGRPEP